MFGRPEIVRLFLEGYKRLKNYHHEISLVCILSPVDDRFYNLLLRMCTDAGAECCIFPNKPLGLKKIAGLKFACKYFDFDYLMELGSDDIVNPELIDLYKPYMEKKFDFFGLSSLYFVNWETREAMFVKNYNDGQTFGAGRMLHRGSIITEELWPKDADCGLDTAMTGILKDKGIRETVIDSGDKPMIIDIKSNTTINHWKHLTGELVKKVDYNSICHCFGLPTYDGKIKEIQTLQGFETYYWRFRVHLSRVDAYEEVEKIHLSLLGRRKYKKYRYFFQALKRKTKCQR